MSANDGQPAPEAEYEGEEVVASVSDDGYYCLGAADDPLCLCGIKCDYPMPNVP